MCGLLGFIGESKNPEITKSLITEIFVKTQTRGFDASGFYCASNFNSKNVYFYKEPFPSIDFIKNDNYKNLWNYELNLGIFHCRAATQGIGIPAENKNNHPFVSEDNQKAVIHNGYINKSELKFLKSIFETNTDCDSELVLRILEQNNDLNLNLNHYFALTERSAFAVAYAHVEEEVRKLVLFRNYQRPLCLIDLREDLGQLFFCSTPDIFFSAINDVKNGNNIKYGICDFKPYMVAKIELHKDNILQTNVFDIEFKNEANNKIWEFEKIKKPKTIEFNSLINFTNQKSKINELEELLIFYKNEISNDSEKFNKDEIKKIECYVKLLYDLLNK